MNTKIYFLKDKTNNWGPTQDYLSRFISAERREKINRYNFDSDKMLSLYAAILTRLAIVKETGLKNEELLFNCSNMNKPTLSMPNKDTFLDFNFSHTKGAVLLGISTDSNIGVDVERICNAAFDTMEIICHPEEIDYINNSSDKEIAFFEIWTKKEAYTKCIGTGLSVDLKSINTLSASINNNIITFIQNEYMCSVCIIKI